MAVCFFCLVEQAGFVPRERMLAGVLFVVSPGSSGCGGAGTESDWLVAGCSAAAEVSVKSVNSTLTEVAITNGIVAAKLSVIPPRLALTSMAMTAQPMPDAEKLSGPSPLGGFTVNGVDVLVGGAAPVAPHDFRPRGEFVGHRTMAPTAGAFHHVPGVRGSNPSTVWPPRGIRVEFDVKYECSDVGGGTGSLMATAVIELYEETSGFGRRMKLEHNCTLPLFIFNMSVVLSRYARDREITTKTDAAISSARRIADPFAADERYSACAYIQTGGLANGVANGDYGPGLSQWYGVADDMFESFLVVEIVHDVAFSTTEPQRGMSR